MEMSKNPRKVILNVDLTKYDSRCTKDSKGSTMPMVKLSSFGSFDHFVAVKFESGAQLDVAINSLTFI